MASTDYYQTLEISPDASEEEIKAAYRRLARLYHPDTNKDPEAAARFIEIRAAYEVLIDSIKRKEYDAQRHMLPYGKAVGIARAGRRHAFPHFSNIAPVVIRLRTMVYALTAQAVYLLRRDGMLRGIAPWTDDTAYYCHRCQYRWITPAPHNKPYSVRSRSLPDRCPQCQSTDWSEFLLLHCLHCQTTFECEGPLRDPATEHEPESLFFPYDLFPYCPYCNQGEWCASEEARLMVLQEEVE